MVTTKNALDFLFPQKLHRRATSSALKWQQKKNSKSSFWEFQKDHTADQQHDIPAHRGELQHVGKGLGDVDDGEGGGGQVVCIELGPWQGLAAPTRVRGEKAKSSGGPWRICERTHIAVAAILTSANEKRPQQQQQLKQLQGERKKQLPPSPPIYTLCIEPWWL